MKASIREKKHISFTDYSLIFIVLTLLGFGLVMIYSTSSYKAALTLNDSAYYMKKQILAIARGAVAWLILMLVDYHVWERFAFLGIIVSVILIFLVLTPLGLEKNGARRWLGVGSFSFQPAEFVKIAVILYVSALINRVKTKKLKPFKGFCIVMAVPVVMALLIFVVTSNLSSAIIVVGIALCMVFVADSDYRKFVVLTLLVAAAAALVIYLALKGYLGFRGTRITTWLDPEADTSGSGYQTLQGLYAIGSGGFFGKGIGQSMQKLGFVPEAQNDMIFSIICEELGIFGALFVIELFLILLWRLMVLANNAPDLFGAMMIVGVFAHIAIQVILNIAVVTNTIPNTGISLPFISYGGTSVCFLLAEIGMAVGIGRRIHYERDE